MKYMAKQSTFWKDDSGNLVRIVGRVTVVESERNLCDDRPPYFYPVEEETEVHEECEAKSMHEERSSLLEVIYKRNPKAKIRVQEEID